ncbi:hypothetical protein [Nocardia bovistercoris]|uniref:Uncharacterized protein n=1 Tax=Nocardia bovistercoris TaxID=2785916 RepID=A0A931IEC4_9NOCA|nr:hypothetical protein [Nocardia bovistercoris]MBH0778830.1 hypothetical protein [Nocardia bovistercoris]
MNAITPYLKDILGFLGMIAGAAGLWHAARTKTAAESRTAETTAAHAKEAAADARLKTMLDAQRADFEVIVKPLRDDVEDLRREVRDLRTAIDALRIRYRAALDYIRRLRAWGSARADGEPIPEPPADIADEV